MTELFHVLFDYDVLRAGRNGRPATTALRRATAAIEIATVRSADLPVAYRVEHEPDMGPGQHLILRHGGRLWWPLVERTPLQENKTAADFLRDLRTGESELFVRRGLDHRFFEPRRRRRILHDGQADALAAVHRNAANLLIVDDALYAAGGVPLLVHAFHGVRESCIASTGINRAVPTPAGALRIKPALGHRGGMDLAISTGFFYPRGHPELRAVSMRARFGFARIAIDTFDGEPVDPLVVRVDAAFRTAWTAMNRSTPRTRPQGFEALHARFVDACGPDGDDCLSAMRDRALQHFVELFGDAERKPVAVSECLNAVRVTIRNAARSRRFREPALSLTDEQKAALACLGV